MLETNAPTVAPTTQQPQPQPRYDSPNGRPTVPCSPAVTGGPTSVAQRQTDGDVQPCVNGRAETLPAPTPTHRPAPRPTSTPTLDPACQGSRPRGCQHGTMDDLPLMVRIGCQRCGYGIITINGTDKDNIDADPTLPKPTSTPTRAMRTPTGTAVGCAHANDRQANVMYARIF